LGEGGGEDGGKTVNEIAGQQTDGADGGHRERETEARGGKY